MAAADKQFYFNTRTHQVEEGKVSAWSELLGPYPTREAAAMALDIAASRTRAWQAEEEAKERER